MRGGDTTKRLCMVLMASVIFFIAMFPTGNALAAEYSRGLLHRDTIASSSFPAQMIDGNIDTYATLRPTDRYVIKFKEPQKIFTVYLKAVPRTNNARLTFYLQGNEVGGINVGLDDTGYRQLATTLTVDQITLSNSSSVSNYQIYEFDVYEQEPDTTPPAVPTGLIGKAGDKKVELQWNANADADLAFYRVYVDGTKYSDVTTNAAVVTGLENGKEYTFTVSAVDLSGNESDQSEAIKKTPVGPPPPDTTPPAVPSGLTGKGGDKQAILNWNKNTESDLAGYIVYQDGKEIHRTASNSTSVNNLTNGKSYTFTVAAYDVSGNISKQSSPVTVIPSDKIDVNLIPNMDSIIVQIISGTAPYQIDWGNGNDKFNSTQYTIGGLQANTDYTVTITDAQGRVWKGTINTGDKKGFIPPTFPNPQEMFQRMLDTFGTAGTIAVAIIGGAILLGIVCVLAMWAWRLLKNWLYRAK